MKHLTGQHLERRTFLKGVGATVALPLLDAMTPAGPRRKGVSEAADLGKARLIAIENSHGAAGCTEWGQEQHFWAPRSIGSDYDLTGTALIDLEPYQDYLTIVSNADVKMANAYIPHEVGGDHFRSTATFLTQSHVKQTEGSDVYVGTSFDQMFAERFGQDTPIPSMQLCIENINQAGGCAYGYTCVYTDTLSWASPTEPLPVIRDPRVAFEQLFGAGATEEERISRRLTNKSILDVILGRVGELQRTLGPEDRRRMEQYLDNIRELERRIEAVEGRNSSGESREIPEAPAGVPDSFTDHMHLHLDLQVLAFEADMTRVFSLKMSRDSSARVFPESGSNQPFHPNSHHGNVEENILDLQKINRYHMSHLPYLLGKLKERSEGDLTLLDQTMVIYGSPMGDPNVHNHLRVPFLVAGGANGKHQGNQHLRAPTGTPLANVMLTLLHKLGLEDVASFGDSTGEFPLVMPGSLTADAASSTG